MTTAMRIRGELRDILEELDGEAFGFDRGGPEPDIDEYTDRVMRVFREAIRSPRVAEAVAFNHFYSRPRLQAIQYAMQVLETAWGRIDDDSNREGRH